MSDRFEIADSAVSLKSSAPVGNGVSDVQIEALCRESGVRTLLTTIELPIVDMARDALVVSGVQQAFNVPRDFINHTED